MNSNSNNNNEIQPIQFVWYSKQGYKYAHMRRSEYHQRWNYTTINEGNIGCWFKTPAYICGQEEKYIQQSVPVQQQAVPTVSNNKLTSRPKIMDNLRKYYDALESVPVDLINQYLQGWMAMGDKELATKYNTFVEKVQAAQEEAKKNQSISVTDDNSYNTHNKHYITETVEDIRLQHKLKNESGERDSNFNPIGKAIDEHGDKINIVIDIGGGNGWAANLLSKDFDHVYSIEPSKAAQDVGKQLYPQKNITWINGFAEIILPKSAVSNNNEPIMFYSACVMSHLKDDTVIKICKAIDLLAPIGSVIAFSENWGRAFDDGNLWRCRSMEWWMAQFPGWNLTFDMNEPATNGMRKCIIGVKA